MLKKSYFIIMPFTQTTAEHTTDYWTNHFEEFLKPTFESLKIFTVHRSAPLRGNVLSHILTDLITASVVVADLTDMNPNVFWELGVRQSVKHGTITIAEFGLKLPFDIATKATLFYHPEDHIKNQKFISDIQKALKDFLDNPNAPDSQVLETITGRGTLYQIMTKEEALRRLTAVINEIKYNMDTMHNLLNLCENNTQRRLANIETKVASARLRQIAIESLIVNRYIKASDEFYSKADEYFGGCIACNEVVSAMISEENRERTEIWLLANHNKTILQFEIFLKDVQEQERFINQIS
jgi:hypothetical protein